MLGPLELGTGAPVQLHTLRWDHRNVVVCKPERAWPQGRQCTAGQRSTTWWRSAAASSGTITVSQRCVQCASGASRVAPTSQFYVFLSQVQAEA